MKEEFDAIEYEVKIDNAWVSLTADVLQRPSVSLTGVGIISNDPLARVGNISRLEFALNNSETNAMQTRGYYSPGGANALRGWRPGLLVRMYFVYDGIYKAAFYGRINADGIKVITGINGRKDMQVTASGWMREADNQSVELIDYAIGKTADEGIELVLGNMTNQPLKRELQIGVASFPTLFDVTYKDTKASGEFAKLVNSEFGYLYVRGDHSTQDYVGGEVLVFENRQHRFEQRETVTNIPIHSSFGADFMLLETGDVVLLETGDKINLEASEAAVFSHLDFKDMDVSFGKHLYNRARITSYPRRVDGSPAVLWNLENPILIEANSTKNGLRGSYRDPNGKSASVSGINMITPISGTDYAAFANEDGTGTNLTANLSVTVSYGTAEAEYTLQNTGVTDMYVTLLQARGYGVYVYDTASVLYESLPSIQRYGINEISFDLPYVSDASNLFQYSNNIDRILLESGDYILMENDDFIDGDDTDGIFDVLVYDEPAYYIESMTFVPNKSKRLMKAFMSLEAGDFIKISEGMTEIDTTYTYVINGYDLTVKPGGIVEWRPTLVSSLRFARI